MIQKILTFFVLSIFLIACSKIRFPEKTTEIIAGS